MKPLIAIALRGFVCASALIVLPGLITILSTHGAAGVPEDGGGASGLLGLFAVR
jgi:hypothetical protein